MTEKIKQYIRKNGYSKFHPRVAFFDMDGVLFDSMPCHAEAWSIVMRGLGIPFSPIDAYIHEGRTAKSIINQYFAQYKGRAADDNEIASLYKEKCICFSSLNTEHKLVPGTADLLRRLVCDEIEIYLVTGSGQDTLTDTLDIHYPGIFRRDRMITAHDVKHGKPDPEPYLMALQKSGVSPNEAFVIENAPLGVRSAVGAGLFTVAVNTGIISDELLKAEICDSGIVLPDMTAVIERYGELIADTEL